MKRAGTETLSNILHQLKGQISNVIAVLNVKVIAKVIIQVFHMPRLVTLSDWICAIISLHGGTGGCLLTNSGSLVQTLAHMAVLLYQIWDWATHWSFHVASGELLFIHLWYCEIFPQTSNNYNVSTPKDLSCCVSHHLLCAMFPLSEQITDMRFLILSLQYAGYQLKSLYVWQATKSTMIQKSASGCEKL